MAENAKTVLLIDDADMIRELLATAIRNLGYRFASASNGEEGLLLVGQHRPELIILDIEMPGMGGVETCRRIRRQYPDLETTIVFLTGTKTASTVREARAAGGDDYIIKPFEIRTVLDRIEKWLGGAGGS